MSTEDKQPNIGSSDALEAGLKEMGIVKFTAEELDLMQWLSGPLNNDPEWSTETESVAASIAGKMEAVNRRTPLR